MSVNSEESQLAFIKFDNATFQSYNNNNIEHKAIYINFTSMMTTSISISNTNFIGIKGSIVFVSMKGSKGFVTFNNVSLNGNELSHRKYDGVMISVDCHCHINFEMVKGLSNYYLDKNRKRLVPIHNLGTNNLTCDITRCKLYLGITQPQFY